MSSETDDTKPKILVGDLVLFHFDTRWLEGTVRDIKPHGSTLFGCWHARVDDGESGNPDSTTNGFRHAAWVTRSQIKPIIKTSEDGAPRP